MHKAQLPESKTVFDTNWNGVMIVAELKDWVKKVDDSEVAFTMLRQMVSEIGLKRKERELSEHEYWTKLYEQVGSLEFTLGRALKELDYASEKLVELLVSIEVLSLVECISLNLIVRLVDDDQFELVDGEEEDD